MTMRGFWSGSALLGSLVVALASPAAAERATQARLVHCGAETCLRVSGHRAQSTTAVRIAGRVVAAEGGRAWRLTIPIATARRWANAAGSTMAFTLGDPQSRTDTTNIVMLPPGALGSRVELASLEVRAH